MYIFFHMVTISLFCKIHKFYLVSATSILSKKNKYVQGCDKYQQENFKYIH